MVDGVVIVLQHVKAGDQPRLSRTEYGEELEILNPVMAVEVIEERLQARSKDRAEALRRQQPLPELGGAPLQRFAVGAEVIVDAQPEAGELPQIDVILPDLARILLQQYAKVRRPPGSGVDGKGGWGGFYHPIDVGPAELIRHRAR